MILSNTITSAAVQGATVQAAADVNPVLGFSAVGNGRNWVATPGVFNGALNAMGTLVTGTTYFDWTSYGIFTLTCYGGSMTFSFYQTSATAAPYTPSVGQTIMMIITGTGSAAVTWPSTVTWVG